MASAKSIDRLSPQSLMILDDYHRYHEDYSTLKGIVTDTLEKCCKDNGIVVTAISARIKTESSLVEKLERKGYKYSSIFDITDIVGARIVLFYTDEVDKISAFVERIFDVDWDNSVDKRKLMRNDSFGYMSLHYVCRIPETLYKNPEHSSVNRIRFEIQMRTTLQHAWASINHDLGYKPGVGIPSSYNRALFRIAGMLELVDEEFSRIRHEITNYRRKVEELVSDGDFDKVELNMDTFRSYIAINPFASLNDRISCINQAEIMPVSPLFFLEPLKWLGFKTLGDVEKMRKEYSEAAYQLALHQLSGTDLDIISSNLSLQNLCLCYIADHENPLNLMAEFLRLINFASSSTEEKAEHIYENILSLPCMIQKNKTNKDQ